MLYFRLRFLLVALSVALGLVLQYMFGFYAALPAYGGALLLLISFLFLGTVGPAFARLRRGKILEARQLLGMTHFPQLLLRRHKAYYHFSYGMIDLQQERLDQAKMHLEKAMDLKLRNDNDHALAALNLAHIYYVQNDRAKAQSWAEKSRSYKTNDLMIQEKLEELEKALK